MPFLAPAIPAIAGAAVSAIAAHNAPKPGQASAPTGTGVAIDRSEKALDQNNQSIINQQNFLNSLQGQNGIANQSGVFNQQQNLANTFQQQMQGVGPNPALAQLANTTGQNVAQQSALMAGQRGAGANAGLMARQIAQQGANIQQQGAGQAAAMAAQQQLAAAGQLQQQQALMANLSGQQVGQLQNANQQLSTATQNQQNSMLNANAGQASNQTAVNLQNAANQQQVNLNNSAVVNKAIGGIGNAAGAGLASMFTPSTPTVEAGPATTLPAQRDGWQNAAHGGVISHPSGCSSRAGQYLHEMKNGGKVAGNASVPGDNSANDTVPTMLSPGEIVIPRSIAMHPDAPAKAAAFVAALMRKQGK